jgi:hypothetical protein
MIQNIITAAIMNLQVQREFYLSLNYFTRILLDLSLILAFSHFFYKQVLLV